MKIRPVENKDVEAIYAMGSSVPEFKVNDQSGFWEKEALRSWVASLDDVLLLAEDEGKLAGFALSLLHKPTGKAIVENLYVDIPYRRSGVATQLMQECIDGLRSKGARAICAEIQQGNDNTVKLLEKMGFTKGYMFNWMALRIV